MKELESNLNRIFEEHQHESGLHVIGGRRKLMDRLMEFFEQGTASDRTEATLCQERQNSYRQN